MYTSNLVSILFYDQPLSIFKFDDIMPTSRIQICRYSYDWDYKTGRKSKIYYNKVLKGSRGGGGGEGIWQKMNLGEKSFPQILIYMENTNVFSIKIAKFRPLEIILPDVL